MALSVYAIWIIYFLFIFLVYSTILKLVIIFIVSNVSNKELFACRLQCSFLFALARLLFLILCVFSFLTNAPIIVEILTCSNVVTGPNKLHIPFWKSTAHTHTHKKIHFSTPNLVTLKCNVLKPSHGLRMHYITAWDSSSLLSIIICMCAHFSQLSHFDDSFDKNWHVGCPAEVNQLYSGIDECADA